MLTDCPQFLIIGAQKAGSTALSAYLEQHPGVFVPLRKESSYFAFGESTFCYKGPRDEYANRDFVQNWADYLKLFDGAKPSQITGEASVLYLYQPGTAERIHERLPRAKLVVMLRNPVDRAYSAFMHLRRDGREKDSDFAASLRCEDERTSQDWELLWRYRGGGMYAQQLERFLRVFPREQIFVGLTEDMKADPPKFIRQVLAFIGADPDVQIDTSFRMNESGLARTKWLNHVLNKPLWIKNGLKQILPLTWARRVKGRLQGFNLEKAPELDPTVRQELRQYFRPEIERLEQLIDRDLSVWKS